MIEAREAVLLRVVMAAEVAGAGQSTPATTRRPRCRGSREERRKKRGRSVGRSDRTAPDRVRLTQWGLTSGTSPRDLFVNSRKLKDLFANFE